MVSYPWLGKAHKEFTFPGIHFLLFNGFTRFLLQLEILPYRSESCGVAKSFVFPVLRLESFNQMFMNPKVVKKIEVQKLEVKSSEVRKF
jgi:hypothetical protein